ncbi:MAG: hypothetical protein HYY06_32600 [Deltaproteobacteria bacterium]|nr:hypothetical protein [Deltaproteobacteria bacterium]
MTRPAAIVALALSTSCALWNASKDEPREGGEGEGEGEGEPDAGDAGGGDADAGDAGRGEDAGDGGCPRGLQACDVICADLDTDPSNCGECGRECAKGTACCTGTCVDLQSDSSNCGECGSICSADQERVCCAGECARLADDELNCGGCGNVCPGALECESSRCECLSDPRPFSDDPPDLDTVGLWHLDRVLDSRQTVRDSSGNGLHGVLGADVVGDDDDDPEWIENDAFDDVTALSFDGGDYVRIYAGDQLDGAFSVEMWLDSKGEVQEAEFGTLFEAKGSFSLAFDWDGGAAALSILDTGGKPQASFETPLSVGAGWQYLAATFDGTTMSIYLNGVLASSTVHADIVLGNATEYFMGGDDADAPFYVGRIDEVRLSSVARTDVEIASYFCPP